MTRFCRIELRTADVSAARLFYRALLGGDADIVPLPAAAIARGARPHWLGHLGVADVEGVARAFVAEGATPLGPIRPSATGGAVAILRRSRRNLGRRFGAAHIPESRHALGMTPGYRYPPDLAGYVRQHWPAGRTLTISHDLLCEALSIAFHASMTSEETRPTRFRLLLMSPDALPASGAPNQGVLRLVFDRTRAATADELRQLSPSAPFETTLVGVYPFDGKLRIWGLAHSGPAWLAPTWGGRVLVPNWTFDPIVHVTGPGHIAVRCAGKLIGALEQGALVDALMDVFDSEWLPAMFDHERDEVRREHAALQAQAPIPTAAEPSLVGRVGQDLLRRAIQLVLGARHGGLILVADVQPGAPFAGLQGLNLKYRFDQSEPSRRYRTLLLQMLDRLAAGTTNASVDWSDFAGDTSMDLDKLEQSIFEMSRVIAGLAAIDGAVVLDKGFALLGFGAEVSSEIPAPPQIWRALDPEGRRREVNAVEDVGTRHRAAYRFVREHPRGLAIVISHDGGVSFVANRDGEVVSWQQSVSR